MTRTELPSTAHCVTFKGVAARRRIGAWFVAPATTTVAKKSHIRLVLSFSSDSSTENCTTKSAHPGQQSTLQPTGVTHSSFRDLTLESVQILSPRILLASRGYRATH
eukprot:m.66672 g.66672  ORF g.66672 m.66672 type:complete len:107 (+) comp9828_c0_seq3:1793-2113(+)